MAIWHFRMMFVPSHILDLKDGTTGGIIYISEDEIMERRAWKGRTLDFTLFDQVAPETKSWSDEMRTWGTDRGNSVSVLFEREEVESIVAKIDIGSDYMNFCSKLVNLAKQLECFIWVMNSNQCFEPDMGVLLAFMKRSLAYKYVRDPEKALRDYHEDNMHRKRDNEEEI